MCERHTPAFAEMFNYGISRVYIALTFIFFIKLVNNHFLCLIYFILAISIGVTNFSNPLPSGVDNFFSSSSS